MSLVRLALRQNPKQHLLRASLSTSQHQHQHQQHQQSSHGPLRVAAPPRAVWKAPPAAAVAGVRREARSAIHPEVSQFILPRTTSLAVDHHHGPIQPHHTSEPGGSLRLVEFMEQVKHELWEFNAMPLRKRFRIQSLLRCVVVGVFIV